MKKIAQRPSLSINEEELQPLLSKLHSVHASSGMVNTFETRTSPQRSNYVHSPNSPARNAENDIITIVCVHITSILSFS
jgi:hypothetical protein